jgi:mono/diheme cytochrome c family protein
MGTLLFVAFWVVVALGLVVIAVSGGRGGDRGPGRAARRAWVVAFAAAVLVLGIGIPAAVVAAMDARDSIPEADVSNLTAQELHGRELFGERCRNCHSLEAANAEASVGPDLDQLRPPKALVLDAIHNGRARGNGAMAKDLVEGADAEAVAAFVAKAVGSSTQ